MLAVGEQGLVDLGITGARHRKVRQRDMLLHSGRTLDCQRPKGCCGCKDAMLGCQLICLWQAR